MAYTGNVIPAMTSNSAPSGVASASGEYSSEYAAWMAFNRLNDGGGWIVEAATGYIRYQFPSARIITRYAVTTRNTPPDGNLPPKSWTFQGSNDGAAWVTLDAQTNVTDWALLQDERKVFDIVNATAYLYCQLYVTESNIPGLVGVGELEMMETLDLQHVLDAIAVIQAKTENLPASPAAVGSAMTLTSGERTSIATAVSSLATTGLAALKALLDAVKLKSDTIGGAGAIEWTYTLTDAYMTPIADAYVWVTTDEAGNNVVASGRTDAFGVVTFHLDPGGYFIWAQKSGTNFDNPDFETVTA